MKTRQKTTIAIAIVMVAIFVPSTCFTAPASGYQTRSGSIVLVPGQYYHFLNFTLIDGGGYNRVLSPNSSVASYGWAMYDQVRYDDWDKVEIPYPTCSYTVCPSILIFPRGHVNDSGSCNETWTTHCYQSSCPESIDMYYILWANNETINMTYTFSWDAPVTTQDPDISVPILTIAGAIILGLGVAILAKRRKFTE